VIVSRQNPISQLSLEQVRGLFSGQIQTWKTINHSDNPVQVWVFPNGEDVQQIFEQTILDGSPLASTARLAASPEQMSQAVAADVNAVGILTRRWQAGNTTDVFTAAGSLPVLAITRSTPEAPLSQILTCLQK
jgi:phosphate transport system substrate-binding protein